MKQAMQPTQRGAMRPVETRIMAPVETGNVAPVETGIVAPIEARSGSGCPDSVQPQTTQVRETPSAV